jgi:DNA-binding transcriptional LysR family regulator
MLLLAATLMLNTTHLQTFMAVVEAGSYSAAARRLHMTQPAVSQHIRIIEQQLGDVRLFRRVGQKMALTQVGEQLLADTRTLLTMAEQTEQRIRALRGQIVGHILLGRAPVVAERHLAALLALFRATFPLVTVSLLVGGNDAIVELLERQQLDLGLLNEQQRRRGMQSQLLAREEVVLVAAHSHPLLQQPVVPGMLREVPLILPPPRTALRRQIDEALRRRGETMPPLQMVLETEDATTALYAARSGMGLAFVPATLVPPYNVGVDRVVVQGLQLFQEWFIVQPRDYEESPATRELVALMTSQQGLRVLGQEGLLVAEQAA